MNFDALVWQQWVILGYALLEYFILIGTLRETKVKPGALVYQLLRLVILCACPPPLRPSFRCGGRRQGTSR